MGSTTPHATSAGGVGEVAGWAGKVEGGSWLARWYRGSGRQGGSRYGTALVGCSAQRQARGSRWGRRWAGWHGSGWRQAGGAGAGAAMAGAYAHGRCRSPPAPVQAGAALLVVQLAESGSITRPPKHPNTRAHPNKHLGMQACRAGINRLARQQVVRFVVSHIAQSVYGARRASKCPRNGRPPRRRVARVCNAVVRSEGE